MRITAWMEFLNLYKKHGAQHLRMGQFFVGRYIKKPWPELFYEKEDYKCAKMIVEWLEDNQYTVYLPEPIHKIEEQQV